MVLPPLIWDDFERKAGDVVPNVGDLLNESDVGWNLIVQGNIPQTNIYPQYSNDILRGVSQMSGMMSTPGTQYISMAHKPGIGPLHEVYGSMNWYIVREAGVPSWNMKMFRLEGKYHSEEPTIGCTLNEYDMGGGFYVQNGDEYLDGASAAGKWFMNTWQRVDYYYKASNPINAANGDYGIWVDSEQLKYEKNIVTMTSNAYNDPPGDYYYIDDIQMPQYMATSSCSYSLL